MKRAFLSLTLALLATPAAAQTLERVDVVGGRALTFNASACEANDGEPEEITFQYVVTFTSSVNLELEARRYPDVALQGGTCPTPTDLQPGTEVASTTELINNIPTDWTIDVGTLIDAKNCDLSGDGDRGGAALCFHLRNRLTGAVLGTDGYDLQWDTAVPETPVVEAATPGDAQIGFRIGNLEDSKAGDDVLTIVAQYRRCDGGDDTDTASGDAGTADGGTATGATVSDAATNCPDGSTPGDYTEKSFTDDSNATDDDADSTTFTLTGLENGEDYEVRFYVEDDRENRSEVTASEIYRPIPELGPLSVYQGGGSPFSTTPPNCSEAFGMAAPWFLVLALALASGARRRRRQLAGAALALFVLPTLMFAHESRADLGQVTMDLRLSPYTPNIDSEAGAQGLYECFFKGAFFEDSQIIPELGIGGDVHLIDFFGSVQLGMGVGFSQAVGSTRALSDLDGDGSFTCGAAQTGSVELTVVKFRPGLTYRFDPLLDLFDIPLVPYGRFGLVGATYVWTRSGSFDDSSSKAQPVGVVFGWDASLGLMLALDFWDYVDPFSKHTTKRARGLGLFDHAFVFAEASWQEIDNFGRAGWVFSPRDDFLNTGLPVIYSFGLAVEFL